MHMVVAQSCKKYHTLNYIHVRAIKVENKVLYNIGYIYEHAKIVDVVA